MDNIKADILKALILSSEENFEIARDIYENFDGIVRGTLKDSLIKIREKMQELLDKEGSIIKLSSRDPAVGGSYPFLPIVSKDQYGLGLEIYYGKNGSLYYGVRANKSAPNKEWWEKPYKKLTEHLGRGRSASWWPWYSENYPMEWGELLKKLVFRDEAFIDDIAREVKENLIDKRDDIERILQEFHRSTDAEESTD